MRSRSSSAAQTAAGEPARRQRFGRLGSRRLAVVGAVAVGLAGAVAVVAAARATPGDPSHRTGAARTGVSSLRPARARGGAVRAGTSGSNPGSPRTSCRSVAQVGDSTSVDLISSAYLPNPAERLGARYADIGVKRLLIDASGGRSIVEELPGQINGYKVASGWRARGYQGCWVFALGTNDAANVAAGSSVGMMARIDQMMAVTHGEPVMWVNTRTLLSSGPYASVNEQAWDKTLVRALARYPNMRIFNWSAVAQPSWFLSDGIHYNSLGCAMRAKAIADALAMAFPLHGHSAGKIVR